MTLLKPAPISTATITLYEGMMVGEASTLQFRPERVWDDACDVGVTLVSHRTGREVVYVVEDMARDGEGDLLWWDLLPADLSMRFLPPLRVFND